MAISFFDSLTGGFAVIADPEHSFQPPAHHSSEINRDGSGNVTSIVFRNSGGSTVYTLTMTRPDGTHLVITDGAKTLHVTTNGSGQALSTSWV
jgi:hypothetical protein